MVEIAISAHLLWRELGFIQLLAKSNQEHELLSRCVLFEVTDDSLCLMAATPVAIAWSTVPLLTRGNPSLSFAINVGGLRDFLRFRAKNRPTTLLVDGDRITTACGKVPHHFKNIAQAEAQLTGLKRYVGPENDTVECGDISASQLKAALAAAAGFTARHNLTIFDLKCACLNVAAGRADVLACNGQVGFQASFECQQGIEVQKLPIARSVVPAFSSLLPR